MKSSSFAVANRAGINEFFTCSMGDSLYISKLALDYMVDEISFSAGLTKKEGILVYLYASSFTRSGKLENGESNTIPAIPGSRSACKSAVTAPIDLPWSPIVETRLFVLRWSTMRATSSLSNQPSEMYSPSDMPHPAKSKHSKEIFCGNR